MQQLTTGSNLPLQTLSANGQPPARRVKDAEDARQIVYWLKEANRARSLYNAKVKGMIDGNPPYAPTALRNAAQSYRCNVNFMEGKGSLSAALVPYYDLFSGVQHYATVQTSHGDVNRRKEWSDVITEEFDSLLKNWEDFDFNVQSMLHDMVAFGKGFLLWFNAEDWRFEQISQGRVLVSDGAKASASRIDLLVVLQNYLPHALWAYIRNRKEAEAVGWKVENTVLAIQDAMPDDSAYAGTDPLNYEQIQQRFRDRDLSIGVRGSVIRTAHLFVKEFSGKITHYIVCEPYWTGKGSQRAAAMLFEHSGRFQKMQQVVATFFLETLDGSWNGAGGLGREIYSAIEIKNRLKCSAVDNSFLRSGITLQALTGDAVERVSLVQVGALNILPPGYAVQQSGVLADVAGQLEMDRNLEQMLASNTGVYRQRMDKQQGNPRTAEEVRLQYQTSAVLGNSAVNRFYLNLDRMYQEIFRRASNLNLSDSCPSNKAALDFQERCKKLGVPKLALLKIKSVKATRNMGNGSQFMRQQALQSMAPLVPMLPENGRQRWLQDAIAVVTNTEMVERYAPSPAESALPDDQLALAMIENGVMRGGAPVAWTPTQNDLIHTRVHLEACAQAAASIEQWADPSGVFGFLELAGQNIALHLRELSIDPTRKDAVKPLQEEFLRLGKFTDKLREQLAGQQQQAMEAQQSAGGQVSESAVKMQIKERESRQKMALAAEKTRQGLEMKGAKAQQDMAIKDAQAAAAMARGGAE